MHMLHLQSDFASSNQNYTEHRPSSKLSCDRDRGTCRGVGIDRERDSGSTRWRRRWGIPCEGREARGKMSKWNQDRHGQRTVHRAASSTSCLCQDCDTRASWLARGKHTVPRERKQILRNRAAHCLGILRHGVDFGSKRLQRRAPPEHLAAIAATLDLTMKRIDRISISREPQVARRFVSPSIPLEAESSRVKFRACARVAVSI